MRGVPSSAAAALVATLALGVALAPVAAQSCSATYRPVIVDMDSDGSLVRGQMQYVEVTADDGSDIYVKPRGCPAGAREPDRFLVFQGMGCPGGPIDMGWMEPEYIAPAGNPDIPECVSEDAFWADPMAYSCVEFVWGGKECAIQDPSEWGDDLSGLEICCPNDKPNYYVFQSSQDWGDFMQDGFCSAATLPMELKGQGVDLTEEDFDPSDGVDPVEMIDLELMTIKELYQTYDTKAIGMMESLVYANVNGCEASYDERPENSHMQVVAMPPFHKDVASSYFAHLHDNPIPGNDQIRSIRKLSPFSDAKSTKDADGVCQMMVSIIDHDVEGELVSIDGVDVSCLFDAYDRVPDAYVVLDAYSALARTTGAVPSSSENVTVVLRGHAEPYSVKPTFAAYNSLKTKLDNRNDQRWMRDYECGGMDYSRFGGRVNPLNLRPTCERAGVVADVVDPREEAISNMSTSKLGFVFFGSIKSIATGNPDPWMHNAIPPNFDPQKGRTCKLSVHGKNPNGLDGLFNKDGGRICQNEMNVVRASGFCSFAKFGEILTGVKSLIDDSLALRSTSQWTDYLQYTGTDTWIDCVDIFYQSMQDGEGEKTIVTDQCTKSLPAEVYDPWRYCRDDPESEYCSDPCCNFQLQETKCCAPTEQTVTVSRPTFDNAAFAQRCVESDYNARGACGPDCIDSTLNISKTLAPAEKIYEVQSKPDICLEKTNDVTAKVTAIQQDIGCCLKAVVGEWDESARAFTSKQPCNNPDHCFSKSCIKTDGNTNPDQQGDCFPEGTAYTNACAVASADDVGAALATCLISKLEAREGFATQISGLKVLLAGSTSASMEDVGEGILDLGAAQTCEGPDGWLFDPNNFCQNWNPATNSCGEQNCEGVEECKAACLAASRCNWRAWSYDPDTNTHWVTTSAECLDASLSTNFCGHDNNWGGVDDLTESGYCKPNVPIDINAGTGENPDIQWDSPGITDALCDEIDTELGATERGWGGGYKHCTWSSKKVYGATGTEKNNMDSTKANCYHECLDATDGFQPPEFYQCYKEPDSTTGECEATGWFTRREVDRSVRLPEDVRQPAVCVFDEGRISDLARAASTTDNAWDMSDASVIAEWTLTVTGSTSHDGTYDLRSSAWQAITGHTETWRSLAFTSSTVASDVCGALGAQVRALDSSENCGETRCWVTSATEAQCGGSSSLDASTVTDFGHFEWKGTYKGGSGVCFAHPTYNPWEEWSQWNVGQASTTKWKTFCDEVNAIAGVTAQLYIGRHFESGRMDTQDKCEGTDRTGSYCNVAGAWYEVDSTTCDAIGGKCQNGEGCLGCRDPWWNNRNGLCFKSGVTSAGDCDKDYVASLGICADAQSTSLDDCSDSFVTCGDIAYDVCAEYDGSATLPASPSLYEYVSNKIGCKPDKHPRYCANEAQCEAESGQCHGPNLRDYICDADNGCVVKAGTCKVGVNETSPGTCNDSPPCADPNGWCWDPLRDHHGTYCLDYSLSQAECSARSGEWLATDIDSQKAFCVADTECQGSRSEHGGGHRRDEQECELCGGTMRAWGSWTPSSWVLPDMIAGGREWRTRAMEQPNTWTNRLDEWRVRDLIRAIEMQLNNEAQANFAMCMYGEIGASVRLLSLYCGGASVDERLSYETEQANSTCGKQYNGTASENGRKGSTRIETSAESYDGSEGDMCAMGGPAQPTDGSASATSRRRRSLSRRHLLAESDDPSLADASCWSVVRNANDALVGQLTGDCVRVTLTDGLTVRDGVRICLQTKPDREVYDGYGVDAFVVRSEAADGTLTYAPSTKTVTRVGEQICATVTELGTNFCPGSLSANWATATADVGVAECPIVELMNRLQAASQSALLAEDDGLDDASIAGIAVGAFVFLVACAFAYRIYKRRKAERSAALAAAEAHRAEAFKAAPMGVQQSL